MTDTRVNMRIPSARWYDGPTIFWKLVGALTVVLSAFGFILWQVIDPLENRNVNASQDVKIQKVETTVDQIDKRQERMELKQDRMYEKVEQILQRVR